MNLRKWEQKVIPCWVLVLLYLTLMVGFSGCGEGYEEWEGTWTLKTINGQSLEQRYPVTFGTRTRDYGNGHIVEEKIPVVTNISVLTNNWTFYKDKSWTARIALGYYDAWKEGDSQSVSSFSIEGSYSLSYSLSGSSYTLISGNYTGGGIGCIVTWLCREVWQNRIFYSEKVTEISSDTGTWSRKENTLTLTSDYGDAAIVFKKQ